MLESQVSNGQIYMKFITLICLLLMSNNLSNLSLDTLSMPCSMSDMGMEEGGRWAGRKEGLGRRAGRGERAKAGRTGRVGRMTGNGGRGQVGGSGHEDSRR